MRRRRYLLVVVVIIILMDTLYDPIGATLTQFFVTITMMQGITHTMNTATTTTSTHGLLDSPVRWSWGFAWCCGSGPSGATGGGEERVWIPPPRLLCRGGGGDTRGGGGG